MFYDQADHCITCGHRLDWPRDHHCDPKRLKKIEDSQKASTEHRQPREPTYGERLEIGDFISNLTEEE
jgi:hypothetical protein